MESNPLHFTDEEAEALSHPHLMQLIAKLSHTVPLISFCSHYAIYENSFNCFIFIFLKLYFCFLKD